MADFFYSNLNKKQQEAVEFKDGVVLVVAGAGSGKTRALTSRIENLVKNHKVSPYNVLAITFTNKATNEMKERLGDVASDMWISTFHSLCAQILRKEISIMSPYTRFFTIYNDDDSTKILKDIIKSLNIEDDGFLKSCVTYISMSKNDGVSLADFTNKYSYVDNIDDIYRVFEIYEERLKLNNALDFNDLLSKTYDLFLYHPEILKKYQERFQYIHVDEFQDTNKIQYKIVKMLAVGYKNLFVVGDEDQCIYGWRGASIENTRALLKEFDNVVVIKLEQNYRSSKNILEIANKLIKNNISRIDKELWTENDYPETVKYNKLYSDNDEAEYVAQSIHSLINYQGVSAGDIAILYRMNSLSRLFEEKLLNYNIKYVMFGGQKFFDRMEIKNVLAYLWLIYNESDNINLKRIINFPKRGIGKTSIEQIENVAYDNKVSMANVILNAKEYGLQSALVKKLAGFSDILENITSLKNEELSLSELYDKVLELSQITNSYNKSNEEDNNRLLNIGQLTMSVKSFDSNNTDSQLIDYLESVALQADIESSDTDSENAVKLSTIHASKGLEYEAVFVVGAEDGVFPSSRSIDNPMELEEERRLMYVAVTRSKRYLTITSSESRYLYYGRNYMKPSIFLTEMGLVKATNPSFNSKSDYSYTSGQAYEKNYSKNREHKIDYNDTAMVYNITSANNMGTSMYNYAKQTANFGNNINKINSEKLKKQANEYLSYVEGVQVLHTNFGIGEIIKSGVNDGDLFVTIKFSIVGVKTLSLEHAPLQIIKK